MLWCCTAAVFGIYDESGSGYIATEHIPSILEKLGRNATEGARRERVLRLISFGGCRQQAWVVRPTHMCVCVWSC